MKKCYIYFAANRWRNQAWSHVIASKEMQVNNKEVNEQQSQKMPNDNWLIQLHER